MMEEGKAPLLAAFSHSTDESNDDDMIIQGLDNSNNNCNDSKIAYNNINNNTIPKKSNDNREDTLTTKINKDDNHRGIIFEHDINQLRDYYYEKRYSNTLFLCINCCCCMLGIIVLCLLQEGYYYSFGLFLWYITLLMIYPCYNILLKYLHSKYMNQIVVDPLMITFISSNGIGHVQPREQQNNEYYQNNKPNGGEIFIPFHDIEDVEVSISSSTATFAVTKVDIKLKGQRNDDNVSRFVVSGYPSFLLYDNKKDDKYKIEIFGIVNPHNLKCAIMEKIIIT